MVGGVTIGSVFTGARAFLNSIDLDLRPSRKRDGGNIFLVLLPTPCLHGDRMEGGRLDKCLIFGGPCRGRTYGPLIKSGRRPMIRTARCCEGFPVYL